ncbi:hypothetical protein OX284_014615 [Flavobacterium sp. SUN046]|uniref:DUF6712 family protein n=1 Tax=Flavobacterium sp. SUN046 TaxID=3002440 RepID=UPI002DBD4E06|nr:hypothetical protein [Flavobacterium sp. SUN046]MEC4050669.1 hypothetical protein [Flavobacterium sp. SUN046]
MILLIDKTIVSQKLQVAIGYDTLEFNTFINEAQEFDLKPLVREEFYMDLLNSEDQPVWKLLIDGGSYQYKDRTYYFQGISTVLAYYAYARFVMNSGAVSTSHGMVIKTNPNSQPLSLEERKNFYYKKRAEAGNLFNDIKKFIERKYQDYPSFFEDIHNRHHEDHKRKSGFSTRIIQ